MEGILLEQIFCFFDFWSNVNRQLQTGCVVVNYLAWPDFPSELLKSQFGCTCVSAQTELALIFKDLVHQGAQGF